MKFTVKRSQWYRGKGLTGSLLLRADGMRCCIGFVGAQCGVPDAELLGISTVANTNSDLNAWPKWMREQAAQLTSAYRVNDDKKISEEKREAVLQKIFKHNGDEIEFVD